MSAAGTTRPAVTAVPSSVNAPAVGSVTTVTLTSASPGSVSAKLNSAAAKGCAVSSSIVTDESAAVGAVLPARVTLTVAVSVPGAMPFAPPRPVTVRVKVSSVSAVSAGIVASGVTLVSSSIVTPLAGSGSAQP